MLLLCRVFPGSPAPRSTLRNGNSDDDIHKLKGGLACARVNMVIVPQKMLIIKEPDGQSPDYFEAFRE